MRENKRHYTKKLAWLLGLMASDGWIYRNEKLNLYQVGFESKDIDLVKKVKKLFGTNNPIKKKVDKRWMKPCVTYSIRTCKKDDFNFYNSLGIEPNKSLVLKMPNIPNKLMSHFIRGYFDGDGGIEKDRKNLRPRFTTGSTLFANQLANTLRNNGFPASIHNKNGNCWDIYSTYKLWPWLYANCGEWYGERKKQVLDNYYGKRKRMSSTSS